MFDRPSKDSENAEKTLLVQVSLDRLLLSSDQDEFKDLALSSGAEIFDSLHIVRKIANSKFLIGKGKAEEIVEIIKAHDVKLVMFNASLSPSQERNLEAVFECRVLDRTGLILDIFAQRARSYEGKLQVELAQLEHLSTRLIRGWTHLERQKGGIGLRGPGETQLETDRRLLTARIKQINKRLKKVSAQRSVMNSGRKRKGYPVVAVVGYTNAGKSTLFNKLTDANVYVQDQLFATLDTTLRKLSHSGKQKLLLTDTVGFISNLPHELVESFKSTLQETIDADLILHIIDSADKEHLEKEHDVLEILKEIGADKKPVIRVYNKIDLTDQKPCLIKGDNSDAVFVSSTTGAGIEILKDELIRFFYGENLNFTLKLLPTDAKLRAMLFDENAINSESYNDKGEMILECTLSKKRYNYFLKEFKNTWQEM